MLTKLNPDPSSYIKFLISSNIICCKTFLDISVYLSDFLINIGFFTKSGNNGSSFAISFDLALSLNLSYSLDLIRSRNYLFVKLCLIHKLI